MIEPMSQKKMDSMVRGVIAALIHGMPALTKAGYDFINLASGFIAHYNHGGFIDHYSRNPGEFRENILRNKDANMWNNFRQGDENYDYYMQKAEIYRRICAAIK